MTNEDSKNIENNSASSFPFELRINEERVKEGVILPGEEKKYLIDNEKFSEGMSDLSLYMQDKTVETTEIDRHVPNYSEKGFAKPGIGDNEDLMPYVFDGQGECQNDILKLYLNGFQKEINEYYPEIEAEFRLWAEGERRLYRALPYDLDIFTYPNLKYDYKLEKICPDSEDIDCIEEWGYQTSIASPESPKILPNELDWEPTGETIGEKMELEYEVYVEVYTVPLSEEERPDDSMVLEPGSDLDIDYSRIISQEDQLELHMDEDKTIEGHFGTDHHYKSYFLESEKKKVYQPDGTEKTHTITITSGRESLIENLMTLQELEDKVEGYIGDTGNVVVEIVDIITDHEEEDITVYPEKVFSYEENEDIVIEAKNEDYEVTGCAEPAIRIVDESPYTNYSAIDADITFANGQKVAYEPQELIGHNNFEFNRNDYVYDDGDKFDDSISEYGFETIRLPDMGEIEGFNEDIIRDVTVEIRDELELQAENIDIAESVINDENIPGRPAEDIFPSLQETQKLIGDYKFFHTGGKIIGDVECFRTDLPHNPRVFFAYSLEEGDVDLAWEYDSIREELTDDNMTLFHDINTETIIPSNDYLNITPLDAELETEIEENTEEYISDSIYVDTDMFYSSINGVGKENEKGSFVIDYDVLPIEQDDSAFISKYIPIDLGAIDYRVAIPLPTDIIEGSLSVYAELVEARISHSNIIISDQTELRVDNRLGGIYEDRQMWDSGAVVDDVGEDETVVLSPDPTVAEKDIKTIFAYYDEDKIDEGKIVINSSYTANEYYRSFWQSDEPVIVKLTDICPGDIEIIPDTASELFTSRNIRRYWDIPDNVYGPYTISIETSNNMVDNEVNYSVIPDDVEGAAL